MFTSIYQSSIGQTHFQGHKVLLAVLFFFTDRLMITSSFRLLSVTCQLVFRFSVFNAKTHTLNDVDKQNTHGTRCFSVITIGVRCYSAASYTHRVLFVRIFVDGILLHRKKNSSLKWLSAISPSSKWKSSSAINV